MGDLRQPAGMVALAAVALALICLVVVLILMARLRRLRSAQAVVLGDSRREDLAAHAAKLERAFEELQARFDGVAERLDGRMATVEQRLDGAIAHRALVRYDAYGEMAGRQSMSLALLDAHRNGMVISSIAHRDTARMYCKPIAGGDGEQPLSPEEQEAIRLALDGRVQSVTL